MYPSASYMPMNLHANNHGGLQMTQNSNVEIELSSDSDEVTETELDDSDVNRSSRRMGLHRQNIEGGRSTALSNPDAIHPSRPDRKALHGNQRLTNTTQFQ